MTVTTSQKHTSQDWQLKQRCREFLAAVPATDGTTAAAAAAGQLR